MKMELIDRQATWEKIDALCKAYALHEPAIKKCREIVEKQPTIEPEVMSNESNAQWLLKQSIYDILCQGQERLDKDLGGCILDVIFGKEVAPDLYECPGINGCKRCISDFLSKQHENY